MKNSKKFTYHWVIVIACFFLMAASIGITTNCFNLFTVEIMRDLGYSASKVQIMNTIATVMNLIGSLCVGAVMKKIPMRVAMPIYGVIMAFGFFMYSRCTSLTSFYVMSVFVGFGKSGVSVIPCGVLMNNWFKEKRGFATGLALSGSVAGGFVFVRVAKAIIAATGWRNAYMILGIVAAVIVIPVAILLVRESPADKNMLPLGATSLPEQPLAKPVLTGISRNKFLRTPGFWLLGLSFFLMCFINMALQGNISIYLTKCKDQTAGFAADIVSIVMLSQILGKILLGSIYDKKGVKFGSVYCAGVYILAIVAMLFSGNNIVAVIFGVICGLICSMTTVTPPLLSSMAVGRREYSSIYGLLNVFGTAGVAFGPVAAGAIFDATGSYDLAWYIFAGLSVVVLFTTLYSLKKCKGFSEMTE